ncbi:major facilitator superfamily MFS_1 [Methanosalsum zhilinae DSM 4017]|uniref:Major facilitator superfamily MFS_1 n=2 Tax=Methanosalsum zhilinae TaxID=39669 RepID=F7XNE7_METZD|nr:major facilitator superfamily MFS_1 [Methanosalsum zhilinae DSM 4017]
MLSDKFRMSLYPILLVNFIGTLGFSLVLPFLVFLVEAFGGNAIIYGLIAAMYPAFQLIGAPLLGRWSDIYGRRKILLISQVGTFISWMIFLVALVIPVVAISNVDSEYLGSFVITVPLILLFVARSLDGITGGNVSVANAYLADITPESKRNESFGKMSVSTNLGFIAGPAIAGILSITVYAEILPVLAAVIISFVGILLIALLLPESRKCVINDIPQKKDFRNAMGLEIRECTSGRQVNRIMFADVMKLDHIPYMFLIYFLIFLGFNIYYTSFPVHAIEVLQWDMVNLGIYFSLLSLMMATVEGPILSRISKKYSEGILAVAGSFILGINFLLLYPGEIILTYVALIFFAAGNGLMWPSVLSILSTLAGNRYQGAVQGTSTGIMSIASISGLIAGGLLYELAGSAAFLISAIIIYCVFVLSFRMISFNEPCKKV